MPLRRICWIMPRMHAADGGVQRVSSAVAAVLRRRGLLVDTLSAHLPDGLAPDRAAAQLDGRLRAVWSHRRPDIVHCELPGSLAMRAAAVARDLAIPATGTWHQVHRHAPADQREAVRAMALDQLRSCQGAFCLTPDEAGHLAAAGIRQAVPRLGGVDHRLYHPGRRRASWRRTLGIDDAAPVILTACRLVPPKNLALVAAAAHRLRSAVPAARWLVAGDGPERDVLAREPAVTLLGSLHGEDLAALYADADLLLHPCPDEPLGLVVPEAMACGTPVAAFDHGAARLLVRPGSTGALARAGDGEELIALCLALAGDRARLASLRPAAAAAVAGWTWEAVADRYLGLWSRLAP